MTDNETKQTYSISGDKIMDKVKEVVKAGNARRITIKNNQGKIIAEFPLSFGVVGAVAAPVVAAIGAIVALASDCTLEVEKSTNQDTPEENS